MSLSQSHAKHGRMWKCHKRSSLSPVGTQTQSHVELFQEEKRREAGTARVREASFSVSFGAAVSHYPGAEGENVKLLVVGTIVAEFWKSVPGLSTWLKFLC